MKVEGDPAYIWFVVPSVISCIASLTMIVKITTAKNDMKKLFHQLSLILAFVDIAQCVSWFIGPRYETSTHLCYFQEYLFQWATLSKMFVVVVISNSIFRAIKFGDQTSWRNNFCYLYCTVFVFLCIILSISFQTAEIFCPYNHNQNLYYKNWSHDDDIPLRSFIAMICCYFMPLGLAFAVVSFFTFQSIYLSQQLLKNSDVYEMLYKLRFIPVVMIACIVPLSAFFVYTIATGIENHTLLQFGASLNSCSGLFVCITYFYISVTKKKKQVFEVIRAGSVQTASLLKSKDLNESGGQSMTRNSSALNEVGTNSILFPSAVTHGNANDVSVDRNTTTFDEIRSSSITSRHHNAGGNIAQSNASNPTTTTTPTSISRKCSYTTGSLTALKSDLVSTDHMKESLIFEHYE